MKITFSYLHALFFVFILYALSIGIAFLIPDYSSYYQTKPITIFGWLWFGTFSLLEILTTWIPIIIIALLGTLLDLFLSLILVPVINTIHTLFPTLIGKIYYKGITFQNSIDFIIYVNEYVYPFVVNMGEELVSGGKGIIEDMIRIAKEKYFPE